MSIRSQDTKRRLLKALLGRGQPTTVVINPSRLYPDSGIPRGIIVRNPLGISLDLNPGETLDPVYAYGYLIVSVSFGGERYRCRIPWKAFVLIGVGFEGSQWLHEGLNTDVVPSADALVSANSRPSRLRLLRSNIPAPEDGDNT